MQKKLTIFTLLTVLLTPSTVFAAPQDFGELVYLLISFINTTVSIIIALAVLGFFWGIFKYIFSAGDSSKIEEGRKIMVWGIITIFVMVSIWGILRLLSNTFLSSGSESTQQQYFSGRIIDI